MLNDRSAKDQSKRLAKLGIELSPERLQEVHAGAPLDPSECEVDPSVAVIGAGETPEQMEARVHRQMFREFLVKAAVLGAVVILALVAIAAVLVAHFGTG
jgi:hypothetical protein